MLDFQKINHNYIIRTVIFSAFLYKSDLKNKEIYQSNIQKFISNKLPKINISIIFPIDISKDESRNLILDKILYDSEESNISKLIVLTFKTPLKEVSIQIDLDNQEKYELFLYG